MTLQLHLDGELAALAAAGDCPGGLETACFPGQTTKDLIEARGVPHTEVHRIEVNGQSVDFDFVVHDGDCVEAFPCPFPWPPEVLRPPIPGPQFLADLHLGRCVRLLRLLGLDCVYAPPWDDLSLAERSSTQARVLLSRDRGLLMRRIVVHGIYLQSDRPPRQLEQILDRVDVRPELRPFSRCLRCNGLLQPVCRADVIAEVPAETAAHVDRYRRCAHCGRLYWPGAHMPSLSAVVQRAEQHLAAAGKRHRQGQFSPGSQR